MPEHGEAVKPEHGEAAKTVHEEAATPPHGEAAKLEHGHAETRESAHGEEAHHSGHADAPEEKEPAHEAHEVHESHESHGGHESSEAPALTPHPDTAFARAVDWEKGTAEILEYNVKRTGIAGENRSKGKVITERLYLKPDGQAVRKRTGNEDVDILNTTLYLAGEQESVPFAVETVTKLPRKGAFALLRQDQTLQGWPGTSYRALDCRSEPPRLRIVSSGGETSRDSVLVRWPVYTEEMLFTYLRALPQRAGYREEVWFQDWGGEGRIALKPQFATISVRSKAPKIRDLDSWYITVDRDDGHRSEFWVSATGLHPIVVALLADGTEWSLQSISRKKYW